jgi:thiol-disulfide isomerase/thioredoxin
MFSQLTYKEALAKAKDENKLVFLDFRADWCKPCIEMEQTTFLDSSLGDLLNNNCVNLKIDVDQFSGMDLRDKFTVHSYPTMLLIDPVNETVQLRMIGYKTATILKGDVNMVLDFWNEVEETSSDPTPNENEPEAAPEVHKPKKKCAFLKWLDKITE